MPSPLTIPMRDDVDTAGLPGWSVVAWSPTTRRSCARLVRDPFLVGLS